MWSFSVLWPPSDGDQHDALFFSRMVGALATSIFTLKPLFDEIGLLACVRGTAYQCEIQSDFMTHLTFSRFLATSSHDMLERAVVS